MPTPRNPLPPNWGDRPFLTAQAARIGVGANVVRHSRFDRPFHGVRRRGESPRARAQPDTPDSQLIRDALAFALLLRDGEAFSHETALVLLGCPIRHHSVRFPVHVTTRWPRRARRAAGVVGHATRFAWEPVADSRGLPVAPPHFALIQAAERLPLRELVVAIDHLVLPRRGLVGWTPASFTDAWQHLGGRGLAGIGTARRALALARTGAESRMETLLRLILEAYGLAKYFQLQCEIYDKAGFVGRFDLVCKELKLIVEYDGEQHRTDQRQYLRDLRRLDRARAEGYLVLRFHAGEVLRGHRQIAERVAHALGV